MEQLVELVGLSGSVAMVDTGGYDEKIRHCLAANRQDAVEHVVVVGFTKSLKHRDFGQSLQALSSMLRASSLLSPCTSLWIVAAGSKKVGHMGS